MSKVTLFFAGFGLACSLGCLCVLIFFGPNAYRFFRDDAECRQYMASETRKFFARIGRWLMAPFRWLVRFVISWWLKRAGDLAGLVFVAFVVAALLLSLIVTQP